MGEKKLDLLWPQEAEKNKLKYNQELMEDLKLEEVLDLMLLDKKYRNNLEDEKEFICDKLTSNAEVIKYRLAIIEDLLNKQELRNCFLEIMPLLNSIDNMRNPLFTKDYQLKSLVNRIGELELYVEVIEKLNESFADLQSDFNSEVLHKFANQVKATAKTDKFKALVNDLPELKKEFEQKRSLTIGVNLDTNLMPQSAVLVSVNSQRYTGGSLIEKLFMTKANKFRGISNLTQTVEDKQPQKRVGSFTKSVLQSLDQVMKDTIKSAKKKIKKYMDINSELLLSLAPALKFYLGAVQLIEKVESFGLPICRPEIAEKEARLCQIKNNYNLYLAQQFYGRITGDNSQELVKNEVNFDEQGRIFILTGPNQGGKTVYTQAVGISQVLLQLGVYIPGEKAVMSPVDGLFTHFQIEEKPESNLGRLGEECNRLKKIFKQANRYSLILLNESLASTSPTESLYIAKEMLVSFKAIGVRAIYATHFHKLAKNLDKFNELAPGDSKLKSLVSVTKEDKTGELKRTYKIVPKAPEGLSHAKDIADDIGIRFDSIMSMLAERDVIEEEIEFDNSSLDNLLD